MENALFGENSKHPRNYAAEWSFAMLRGYRKTARRVIRKLMMAFDAVLPRFSSLSHSCLMLSLNSFWDTRISRHSHGYVFLGEPFSSSFSWSP